jgi:hypothetical protein
MMRRRKSCSDRDDLSGRVLNCTLQLFHQASTTPDSRCVEKARTFHQASASLSSLAVLKNQASDERDDTTLFLQVQ